MNPNRSSSTRGEPPRPLRINELVTLAVTNTIKIGGLGVLLHEIFAGPPDPRTKVLAVALVMMAGAQGIEGAFRAFLSGAK